MVSRLSIIISILTLFSLSARASVNQADSSISVVDIRSENFYNDSINQSDTVTADTVSIKKKKKQVVDEPVFYSANDSMSIVIDESTVLLWGKGKIEYQDIQLESDFISSNLDRQEVLATGKADTAGRYVGTPLFKKGNEEFESDSILYNLKSSKGIIYAVKSEQGEGYLHSSLTKRNADGTIHIKGGKYTTCEADHPHFYMALTKAIVIPNDKIVSGPAYMVIEDVPIPILGLPFSFFPSSSKRGAGVIIPTYGEEVNRGFYLRRGGWYQPLGQYVDVSLLGDIYSKGSWQAEFNSNYKVRYKFGGTMKLNYAENKDNSNNTFAESSDFRWLWNHRQDAKANPTSNFSASVNFSSGSYDQRNTYNVSSVTKQQKSSSISYSKRFEGTPFNLSVSANARQNAADTSIALELPKGSFTASTVYPFRNKKSSGKLKWYENIGLSYSSQFNSKINTKDSLIFQQETWEKLNYGFQHSIPLIINLKTDKIKMLTISPSLSYSGAMNSWYQKKHVEYQAGEPVIVTDTIWKPTYAHAINPSISVGLTPKVTGMYLNSKEDPNLIAIRHVMQPKASFSYVPDMSKINPNYYDTIYYQDGNEIKHQSYSYFDGGIYRTPSFNGRSGRLSLGLSNNLEAKLKPLNDTIEDAEPRKVSLIKSLNINTSYNPFATEYKWSKVSLNANTSLFKNVLSINISSGFDPYDFAFDTNSNGSKKYYRINEFNYSNGKGILRFTNLSISTSFSLKSKRGNDEEEEEDEFEADDDNSYNPLFDPLDPESEMVPGSSYSQYVDFEIPWSIRVSHTYSINRQYVKETQSVTNTINLSGDFSLTPKWKIGFRTGYDFEQKKVSMTNLNISRDLHCWMMRISVVPFGTYKSYNFTINAKASILNDLKWDKRDVWYDNF